MELQFQRPKVSQHSQKFQVRSLLKLSGRFPFRFSFTFLFQGGCMAEVGVACSMSAAAFAACMGASPEVIENAAEIGIERE